MSESDTAETADSQWSDSAIMLQLTAYLDGELDGREIQVVEERLATDQKYRSLMQELQQTWDVLDILPSSSASSDFTRSTMKLVVDDAKKLTSEGKKSIWTWPLRALALLLLPCIAALVAFMLMRYVQEEPNRRLRRDFAVIKDYDVLTCERNLSIEFLEALADNPRIFGSLPLPNDERYASYSNDEIKLATLPSEEGSVRERVRTNREGFLRLDTVSQKKVRKLNSAVDQSDRRDELRYSLYQYYKWLDGIGETDCAVVMDAPTIEEKISTIKKIVDYRYLSDFANMMQEKDLNSIYISLIRLLVERQKVLDDLFVQLFDWEDESAILNMAKSYTGPNKDMFILGARLKKIYSEYPERIEQLVYVEDIDQITNSLLLSEDGKFIFKNADILSSSVKSEAHLLASWMVRAHDAKFSPEDGELLELFKSLPTEKQDELNNEFPADRKRELMKIREEKFQQR